jgi:hypothetical protein
VNAVLRRVGDLFRYRAEARDGHLGHVRDVYFDDRTSQVRYFVIDTRAWLGRRVLIAPEAVLRIDDGERKVALGTTVKQVRQSPPVDAELPVSARQEKEYVDYYGWPYRWSLPGVLGMSGMPDYMALPPADMFPNIAGDPSLRSARTTTGYTLLGSAGPVGLLEEFLVDDTPWFVRYLVVQAGRWHRGGRFLLAARRLHDIDWRARRASVGLDTHRIEQAPAWDAKVPPTREYERQLASHYEDPPYWEQGLIAPSPK